MGGQPGGGGAIWQAEAGTTRPSGADGSRHALIHGGAGLQGRAKQAQVGDRVKHCRLGMWCFVSTLGINGGSMDVCFYLFCFVRVH